MTKAADSIGEIKWSCYEMWMAEWSVGRGTRYDRRGHARIGQKPEGDQVRERTR